MVGLLKIDGIGMKARALAKAGRYREAARVVARLPSRTSKIDALAAEALGMGRSLRGQR